MTTDTPTYDATLAEHPDVPAALARPRWTYAAALKAADRVIAMAKKTAPVKRPAKKTARKGKS